MQNSLEADEKWLMKLRQKLVLHKFNQAKESRSKQSESESGGGGGKREKLLISFKFALGGKLSMEKQA